MSDRERLAAIAEDILLAIDIVGARHNASLEEALQANAVAMGCLEDPAHRKVFREMLDQVEGEMEDVPPMPQESNPCH